MNPVDASYIRLYTDDVVIDELGDEWILSHNDPDLPEYVGDFYFRLRNAASKNLLNAISSKFSTRMNLKWNKDV